MNPPPWPLAMHESQLDRSGKAQPPAPLFPLKKSACKTKMPTISVRHASERRALAKDRAEIDARAVEVADMLAKLECERAEFEEHRAAAKIALEQEKAASASELKAAWHKVQDAEAKVEEAALCGAGGAGVGEQEEEAETESHDPSLAEDRAGAPSRWCRWSGARARRCARA